MDVKIPASVASSTVSMAIASRRVSMCAGSYSNGAYTKSGVVPSDRKLVLASIRLTGVTSRRKRMLDAMSANSRSIATSLGRSSLVHGHPSSASASEVSRAATPSASRNSLT